MYTGHIAVALAAEHYRRRVPLFALVLVAQAPDWVEQFLTVIGRRDHAQIWSHSIPYIALGMAVVAVVYTVWTRDVVGVSLLCAVYLTHPVLDLVTASKPWWPGGPAIGGCLYDLPAIDWVVECAVLYAGWVVYRGGLGDKRRQRSVIVLLLALVACQSAVDGWQRLRLYRVGESAWHCSDVDGPSASTASRVRTVIGN